MEYLKEILGIGFFILAFFIFVFVGKDLPRNKKKKD